MRAGARANPTTCAGKAVHAAEMVHGSGAGTEALAAHAAQSEGPDTDQEEPPCRRSRHIAPTVAQPTGTSNKVRVAKTIRHASDRHSVFETHHARQRRRTRTVAGLADADAKQPVCLR